MIPLPITVSAQSKHHACLYDADGAYLATTRTDLVAMVKAAFEAAGNRLGEEYVDAERFGEAADVYNSAVGYCIGAIRARAAEKGGSDLPAAAPLLSEAEIADLRPAVMAMLRVSAFNTPCLDESEFLNQVEELFDMALAHSRSMRSGAKE